VAARFSSRPMPFANSSSYRNVGASFVAAGFSFWPMSSADSSSYYFVGASFVAASFSHAESVVLQSKLSTLSGGLVHSSTEHNWTCRIRLGEDLLHSNVCPTTGDLFRVVLCGRIARDIVGLSSTMDLAMALFSGLDFSSSHNAMSD